MNHEVEREVGELAKLRRLKESVLSGQLCAGLPCGYGCPQEIARRVERLLRADDIDEALKEVGGE